MINNSFESLVSRVNLREEKSEIEKKYFTINIGINYC